jgi:hypothetical protein
LWGTKDDEELMIGKIIERVLRFLHLMPLSLAEKCRIMFGAAVLLSLILALLIPYVWMRQLTGKMLLDTNKARSDALLRSHFRPVSAGDVRLAELNEHGAARDPNERS